MTRVAREAGGTDGAGPTGGTPEAEIAAVHVTCSRVANRPSEWIIAGPSASANTRHAAACTQSGRTQNG